MEQTHMDADTRQAFNTWLKLHYASSVRPASRSLFAPLPGGTDAWPVDDNVYDRFLDLAFSRNEFLGRVTHVRSLDTLMGNIFRDDLAEFILKRTNVSDTVKREPTITGTGTPEQYQLRQIEWDVLLKYENLRQWAKRGPEWLQTRIMNQVATKFGNNVQWVGFRGTSDGNPPVDAQLLDLETGWLQLLRAFNAGAQFMNEVVAASGVITVGPQKVMAFEGAAVNVGGGVTGFPVTAHGRPAGSQIVINGTVNYDGAYLVLAGSTADQINITKAYVAEDVTGKTGTHTPDYKSLDELVADLRNSIPEELRIGLEAIVSEDLRAADEEAIYGEIGRTPTEKVAAARAMLELAGLPRSSPYGMPDGTILVAPPANLAVYWHEEMHRRVQDSPERNGIVLWNDTHKEFVVSDYRQMFAAENIVITR